MELVYDENTVVCPTYAGRMWIGVDGLVVWPSFQDSYQRNRNIVEFKYGKLSTSR